MPILLIPAGDPLLLPLALGAFVAFLVLETIAAAYLLIEARRRSGAARVRLVIAGLSTALLAVAILVVLLGAASEEARAITNVAARAIALVAAIGYAVAFLPPRSAAPVVAGRRRVPAGAPAPRDRRTRRIRTTPGAASRRWPSS